MVGRPGQYQFSCNSGELAPELWGNTGLKQYYAGLAQALNIEPLPQGGFDLLPRTRYRAELPLTLDPDTGKPAARCFPFSVSRTAIYMAVFTPLEVRIFKAGVLKATVATPFAAADLKYLKFVQRNETMFLLHQNYAIRRLLRHGDDVTWSLDAPAFANIPIVQYDGTYTNVSELWKINFLGAASGDEFVVSVNSEETNAISYSSGTRNDDIKAAIEALANVDPGITVTGSFGHAANRHDITFDGGTNPGQNFIVSGRFPTSTSAVLTSWREIKGDLGGEDVFSAARGYPAAARFYQDRLVMGGFAAKPSAFLGSRTGEYFDLNIELATASGGVLHNLDTDGAESIVEIRQSKHLVFFTTEADYFVSSRALSATEPPNVVRSSAYGCSRRVPVVEQESSLLYVNRDETILYAATYDAVSEAYVSTPLSLLSSHLVSDMADAALQKAGTVTDSERYWLVRGDGLAIVGLFVRNQEITAFVRWQTDGLVRAVGVDAANMGYMAVERAAGGTQHLYLETLEEGLWLDAALSFTFGSPQTTVTGLSIHNGASVYALCDGYVEGPFTVAGGAIALPYAATNVTVGRWTAPLAETLPPTSEVAAHTVLKRPIRVHTVLLDVIGTTSLAVGANGRPAKEVPLYRAGQPVDAPLAPFTGEVNVTGLTGFTPRGTATITQKRPGALQVRDITVQARQ